MKTKHILIGAMVFASFAARAAEAPQTEPVNGFYDTKNDWFVFEWINPEDGKMQAFYDSSSKVKPTIHTTVSFDRDANVFTYSFQIGNQKGGIQLLQKIFIDHRSAIFGSMTPSSEWDGAEYRNMGVWEYDKSLGSIHGIPAGQTVNGFSFKSKGLPSIVNVEFVGKRRARPSGPSPDDDSEEVLQSFVRVNKGLRAQYPDKFIDTVKQKTIGPVDPPTTFNAATLIQNLIALVNQSRAQNWIDNDGIANSLLAKLNTAASKVTSDPKTAKNVLGAFLSDVQAQNGKHLSSEAYALLYFNGKFLVDHL